MDTNNSSSMFSRVLHVVLFFAGLLCLYYLYQYLFGPKTSNSYSLLTTPQQANIDITAPITITSKGLPKLFEGGEFTVSMWIYISDWNVRSGYNKAVLRVGGPNFDTLRVYLGGSKPKLYVRLQTVMQNNVIKTNAAASASDDLQKATLNSTYNTMQTDSGLLDSSSPICDLPDLDLQRWVNITIAVDGKTVDVYMDGKLSRSCVLTDNYKVDAGGYSANLLEYGGFGGLMATTTMYDAALNPEQAYKTYMAGPEPITSATQWLSSFFQPSVGTQTVSK